MPDNTNKTSRWIIGVFSLGLMLPLIFNAEQFAPFDLQGGASWWASSALLIVAILFLKYNNKKKWLLLPAPGKLLTLLGICLLLALLTAPHVYSEPEMSIHCMVFLTIAICLLWLLLRQFCLILLVPLLIAAALETGAFILYKVLFNSMVLAETLECSREELMTYATATNISLLIASILILALILYVLCRLLKTIPLRATGGTALLLAVILYILYPFVPNSSSSFSQLGVIGTCKRINRTIKDLKRASNSTTEMLENLPSPAAKPSSLPHLKENDGCIVIFHIGESVRADRCGFNGYKRNTTPHLSTNPHLISWKRCIAAAPLTVASVAVLLTDARRDQDFIKKEEPQLRATCGSVIELFKANNFAVHCFHGALSRQSLRMDKVMRMLTAACDKRHYTHDNVMESIDQIGQCIQQSAKRNMFFLINNEGSHSPFYMYDQENPPFTPSLHVLSPDPSYFDDVNNAYDNCLHYTDLFVHRVLQQLEGRPYIYIYVSDHGEYLSEYDGTWGRARATDDRNFFHQTQEGCGVCAFAITSPQFEALHPHFKQAIAQLRQSRQLTIGHEHFFHTLLGVVGLQSDYYSPSLDLCSPQVKPYTGPQPEIWPEHLKTTP